MRPAAEEYPLIWRYEKNAKRYETTLQFSLRNYGKIARSSTKRQTALVFTKENFWRKTRYRNVWRSLAGKMAV